ncbi:MFS transporter [Methylobacterium sp. J-068]|uniref:MFS transporter n=1 Tax=Methylobacterium sp. J-068 TaxID=2836649 RepID=UPI001FB8CBA8|nr:MFS transporter [Methylobacterium sp. J-068]MCJ2034476.1 MFS transporter [Methylobacterium sp. J-068]
MSQAELGPRRTNIRYVILTLIFLATTFNYVDRATLSVAASAMRAEFGFDAITMGLAFSAFGWAYTAMQIPGGWILDKYGARLVYGIGLILWSAFTMMQGLVHLVSFTFLALFGLRFLMGIAESPAFPANSRLTVMWFPTKERAFATSIFQSAQYFALAVFTPVMTYILHAHSWQAIFFWAGGVGIVLGFVWLVYVHEPRQHGRVNQAEIDYIEAGGGLPNMGDKRDRIRWSEVKALVTNRMMVGIYIGQFCLTTITWFFLTWFPTYLLEARGMSILKVGLVAAIPAICGFLGGLAGGVWSDWMLRRGYSLTVARKLPIITGLLFSSSIVLANYVRSDVFVIVVMSVAFFAKGIGNLGWCIVGDVSPKQIMGVSGGVFNFCGNIASIVTPLAIGIIVKEMGSFDLALVYIGFVALVGAFSYLVIVGPLRRLEVEPGSEPAPAPAATPLPAGLGSTRGA